MKKISGGLLPDAHALFGSAVQGRSFSDVKSLVKSVHIDQRPHSAVVPGRMRVRPDLRLQCIVAVLRAPDSRPTDKKSLLRTQAIYLRPRPRLRQVALQAVKGQVDTAKVTQILAQGESSVDANTGKGLVCIVLRHQPLVELLEGAPVLLGPPVAQIAGLVKT